MGASEDEARAQEKDRAEFLAGRRHVIGSSDAAAVCNISRYRTALHVYQEKVGEAPPDEDTEAKLVGREMEDVIARLYTRKTGREVARPTVRTLSSRQIPYVGASLDRLTVGGERVVECKNCAFPGEEWGTPGTDEVPQEHYLQVQHQLFVYGMEVADIPVLMNGNHLEVYEVPRNEAMISRMLIIYEEFWTRVITRMPPPWDWTHPATPGLVRSMYGVDDTLSVELGPEELVLAQYLEALKEKLKDMKGIRERIEAQLESRMAGAGYARLPEGYALVRKLVKRRGYTVDPTEYRTFSVKPPRLEMR